MQNEDKISKTKPDFKKSSVYSEDRVLTNQRLLLLVRCLCDWLKVYRLPLKNRFSPPPSPHSSPLTC